MSLSNYEYERIDTDKREIRLLVVHPPADRDSDALVSCEFKRISLLDKEIAEYKTISYTWGADNPKAHILVEGKLLPVPINAEKAIRYFRLPDRDRVLWIDAACINQKDDGEHGEKGPHVRYMSLVYSKGQGSLVHLGDDDEGLAGLAFQTVRRLRDNRASLLDDDEVKPGSDEARALTNLFSRPWFRRAWVVQEVALSKSNQCFLGEHSIWCRAFIDLALFYGLKRKWGSDAGQLAEKYGRDAAAAIHNITTLGTVREQYQKGKIADEPDIATLIQTRRECKNPRDMVYSIIGLWDPEVTKDLPPRLRIRYYDSVPKVYRATTRYSIKTRDAPYILYQVMHRTDGELEDASIPAWAKRDDGAIEDHKFPTWVPRWDRGNEAGAPHELSVHFHCWLPWNALVKPKDKCEGSTPDVLRMDGIMIDTVKAVTSPLRGEQQREPVALHDFFTEAARLARMCASGSQGENVTDALAETLIAGCATVNKLATGEDWAPYTSFAEHLEKLAIEHPEQRLPQAMPGGEGRRAYFTRVVTACVNRRFMVTKDGPIGLAPRATMEGDVVVALRNGMWPFVLRAMDTPKGEEQKYQFVGQAYLRGFMQGEIVKECEKGLRMVEPICMV